jgi:hypothetical protein
MLSIGLVYVTQYFAELSTTTIVWSALKLQWLTLVAFFSSFSVVAIWGSVVAWWSSLAAAIGSTTALSISATAAVGALVTSGYVIFIGALLTFLASFVSLVVTTTEYIALVVAFQSIAIWISVAIFLVVFYYGVMYLGDKRNGIVTQ